MKIAIFTDTYLPDANGVSLVTAQLKRQLTTLGQEVYVVTPNKTLKFYYDKVDRILYTPGIVMKRWSDIKGTFYYSKKAFNVLKNINLDIIHVQSEYGNGFFGLKVAKKLNLPIVYNYHTLWESYVNHSEMYKWMQTVAYKVVKKTTLKFASAADLILTPSNKGKSYLQNLGVKKEICSIRNGVDLDFYHYLNQMELKIVKSIKNRYNLHSYFTLVHVGRIVNEKRSFELVNYAQRLCKLYDDIKFLIVGDGPIFKKCQHYLKSKDFTNRVILVGRVHPHTTKYFYHAGDVFVGNSDSETQGLTYVEAASIGLPLLARYDEALTSILYPAKNGYFYSNFEELVEQFKKLKEIRFSGKWAIIRNNSLNISKNFTLSYYGVNILKFYSKAINNFKNATER